MSGSAVFQIEIVRRFRNPGSDDGLRLFSVLEELTRELCKA